jgi:hypothetical protein
MSINQDANTSGLLSNCSKMYPCGQEFSVASQLYSSYKEHPTNYRAYWLVANAEQEKQKEFMVKRSSR